MISVKHRLDYLFGKIPLSRHVLCHSLPCHHLIIDGSNILGFSRQMSKSQAEMMATFESYLEFFLLAAAHGKQQEVERGRAFIVFDSPSGAISGWRRRLNPVYKVTRHDKRGKRLADTGSDELEREEEKPERISPTTIAKDLGFSVSVSSPEDEADDLIGSLASEILHTSGEERITIVSSDSDMIQILALSNHIRWFEILQWPSLSIINPHSVDLETHCLDSLPWLPLRIHQASSKKKLIPPSLYCEWLALTRGKEEAGVKGLGLSSAAARQLLLSRLPSGLEQASESGILEQGRLATTLTCLKMKISPALVAGLLANSHLVYPEISTRIKKKMEMCGLDLSTCDSNLMLAACHPSNAPHIESARYFVQAISQQLQAQGKQHKICQLSNEGLLIDILCDDDCWIIILSPTDFSATAAADIKELASLKRSSPSHLPYALQGALHSHVKMKVKLAQKRSVSLALIPFWEVKGQSLSLDAATMEEKTP